MFRALLTALLAACAVPTFAGTIVEIRMPLGTVGLELYDADKPVTVQNFLSYISSGRYVDSFAHRLAAKGPGVPFVLQGGGFTLDGNNTIQSVPTDPAIVNEYSVGATYSNTYGTIAMARVGGAVNSATSQWFLNLNDNSSLDTVDGGFTVFGHVVYGLDVLDAIAAEFFDADTATNGVFDASSILGSTFTELPLHTAKLSRDNLLFTDVVVVPEPGTGVLLGAAGALFIVAGARVRRRITVA